MSAPKGIERLRRIRALEEEQLRLGLEAAVARVQSLEQARADAIEMERQGRASIAESAVSGEVSDRVAGVVQAEGARARRQRLGPRIAAAQMDVDESRRALLDKRVERHQAAVILEEAAAREELDSNRRAQRAVDDWFGARLRRNAGKE